MQNAKGVTPFEMAKRMGEDDLVAVYSELSRAIHSELLALSAKRGDAPPGPARARL